MRNSSALFTRFVLFLILCLSGWLFLLAQKEHVRDRTIGSEISKLEAEADKMRADNLSLKDRIAYYFSDGFQEREAKEKLDYRKSDEKVVVVRPGREGIATNIPLASSSESGYNGGNLPNYEKWWRILWKSF